MNGDAHSGGIALAIQAEPYLRHTVKGDAALTPGTGPAAHRGRDQAMPVLDPKGRADPSTSRHAACLKQAVRGAQPDDPTAADGVIKRVGFAGRSLRLQHSLSSQRWSGAD
jgi:hypothetical protein